MPIYSEEKVILEKVWIQIPVESNSKTIPLDHETYLVQPRVAEYIVLLEQLITRNLPTPILPAKKIDHLKEWVELQSNDNELKQ